MSNHEKPDPEWIKGIITKFNNTKKQTIHPIHDDIIGRYWNSKLGELRQEWRYHPELHPEPGANPHYKALLEIIHLAETYNELDFDYLEPAAKAPQLAKLKVDYENAKKEGGHEKVAPHLDEAFERTIKWLSENDTTDIFWSMKYRFALDLISLAKRPPVDQVECFKMGLRNDEIGQEWKDCIEYHYNNKEHRSKASQFATATPGSSLSSTADPEGSQGNTNQSSFSRVISKLSIQAQKIRSSTR